MVESVAGAESAQEPLKRSKKEAAAEPRSLAEIIEEQLSLLAGQHNAVLADAGTEAVHKMRVTTRRIQSCLDLLEWNPDELGARKLKRRLRRWRRYLSRVRNYDVFLGMLKKELRPKRVREQQQHDVLSKELRARRARRLAQARPKLEGINVERIAAKLGVAPPVFIASPAAQEGIGSSSPEAVTEVQLISEPLSSSGSPSKPSHKPDWVSNPFQVNLRAAERLEQRLSEFLSMAARAHPTSDPAEIHQLRIGAKRLRYLIERTSEMGYGRSTASLKYLKRVQDRLGEWNDLEGLESEIVAIVSRRKFMRKSLDRSAGMLQTASRLHKKKAALVRKHLPLKVPRIVERSVQDLAHKLRAKTHSHPVDAS